MNGCPSHSKSQGLFKNGNKIVEHRISVIKKAEGMMDAWTTSWVTTYDVFHELCTS